MYMYKMIENCGLNKKYRGGIITQVVLKTGFTVSAKPSCLLSYLLKITKSAFHNWFAQTKLDHSLVMTICTLCIGSVHWCWYSYYNNRCQCIKANTGTDIPLLIFSLHFYYPLQAVVYVIYANSW